MPTLLAPRLLALLLLGSTAEAHSFVLPSDLTEVERRRFERFQTFQIRGVCGDADLEGVARTGANTVRGYTLRTPEEVLAKLDRAHRLGLKMVVSEWMPHHGKNKGRDGSSWEFDYNAKGDQMVADLLRKVEAIGDHPALLMWGLGNEVHLDEPYLRVVQRMSLAIHERFPHHLTSLTVVNVKEPGIEAVKRFAPDIDVLGVQSYSRGAVRGAVRKAEVVWGKPFYMSEFNTNGPWNFATTPWGVPYDEPVTKKLSDLNDCYDAIDASPLCLGSTIFVWGHATAYRPSYFSLLLDPDPNGRGGEGGYEHLLRTPQAELMEERFTGRPPPGNRAPVLSKLEFDGGEKHRLARPGEPMTIRFAAEDPNGDSIDYVTWTLDATARKTKSVAGPFAQASAGHAVIPAPTTPGDYLLLVYAQDNHGGASASTLPFKVPAPEPAPSGTSP